MQVKTFIVTGGAAYLGSRFIFSASNKTAMILGLAIGALGVYFVTRPLPQ